MTINHLNLVVTDVRKSVLFFEKYFEFTCELIKGEHIIAILSNKENFTLVLMNSKNEDTTYPKDFHIGFILNHLDEVDDLYQKLIKDGIAIQQSPRKIRNSYAFYFWFENIFIEVGHYLSWM
ncbi:putative lactoylglutathione lyase [Chryseobacterium bernardetii]|uniref:Glyoxalase/bleomycin resistance protein/dioxygenase superfamily protein n=3 Tax=Chryseobacterium TaxID=59732 RepID=A0A543EI62_9FLAO|nr:MULTISPECIES: VOC family protein [Chryseobacterium]MDR6371209.1 putative lactoylglutathione lyase [Chryseobacterium vietnamense]MDR6441045.1 putative lactoylglutathione lyase [Chryseobacterium bernardetii]MDR6457713.1 putative lactoylglutathione lyase [Chryseobacterium vietnamense]TQM21278.1 glyoxalase/bleomycin resistance protein/dioxygenase superfamily protein [Chryseobacterium aquifrigidense]